MDSCRFHTAPPHLLLSVPGNRSSRRRSAAAAVAAESAAEVEIRVCVNRSCGRQGSREVLEVLSGLAPPAVTVVSCGCLGRCGTGPNLVVLPRAAVVGHCGTPARAAQLLAELCGPGFDPGRNLKALALRRKGEDEIHKGNPSGAQALLSQAIDLQPSGGRHFIYKARSAARLAIGDRVGALEDAEEACRIAPKYPQATAKSMMGLMDVHQFEGWSGMSISKEKSGVYLAIFEGWSVGPFGMNDMQECSTKLGCFAPKCGKRFSTT